MLIQHIVPHLPTKSPNSQRREDETEKQASTIEPSPNLNPIVIAKPGKGSNGIASELAMHHQTRDLIQATRDQYRGVWLGWGTHLAGDAAAEGELPAAASKPPSSPPVEAELSLGVARSWTACWRWNGDPGGGGGGGGGCCSCCWPAAKTTLLSNVDHFMVPTPHPARRSRPDPADSPEFWRDSPASLVSPNKILFTLFLASASRSSPPTSYFCCRLFACVFSASLVFFFVSSFLPTHLHPLSSISLSSLPPRRDAASLL
jgi:hypothetical protein